MEPSRRERRAQNNGSGRAIKCNDGPRLRMNEHRAASAGNFYRGVVIVKSTSRRPPTPRSRAPTFSNLSLCSWIIALAAKDGCQLCVSRESEIDAEPRIKFLRRVKQFPRALNQKRNNNGALARYVVTATGCDPSVNNKPYPDAGPPHGNDAGRLNAFYSYFLLVGPSLRNVRSIGRHSVSAH